MDNKIQTLRDVIAKKASSQTFVHHKWFTKWHLEIVEHIATQLLAHYPEADGNTVIVMVWMHDYGKIVNFASQYDHALVDEGKNMLIELGFDPQFAEKVAANIKNLDSKTNIDQSNIETQIVSSADGCPHLVGPFISLYWRENPDKEFEELMKENERKLSVDWDKKVTLKEARQAYQAMHDIEIRKALGSVPSL